MKLEKLQVYFQTSPSLRLLRAHNAPFIIDFLYNQFKRPGRISVANSDLEAALTAYQGNVRERYPRALKEKADHYLNQWCSGDYRWLHRYLQTGRSEPVFQLTPHTEDILTYIDKSVVQDFGFVGTESRLRLVIQTLEELVIGASADPKKRLEYLKNERDRLDVEIRRIETEGSATGYNPAQIKERFATAVSLLKQLQGDFRAVEEKFKEITRDVQQRQHDDRQSRGDVLEFALDREDLLGQEDQGISFHDFVRFILNPQRQEKLQSVLEQLGDVDELAEYSEDLKTVRRMVPLLLAEAEQVMRTNERLSATLRRLLDGPAVQHRQRMAQLLREIKDLAASMSDNPPVEKVELQVESRIPLASPFARGFWSEPPQFVTVDLSEHFGDDQRRAEAFQMLASMQRLDWRGMRDRVRDAVAEGGRTTLCDLLEKYPPQAGVVEVLGYLQIARDDGHDVNPDQTEQIIMPPCNGDGRMLELSVPLVTFEGQRSKVKPR